MQNEETILNGKILVWKSWWRLVEENEYKEEEDDEVQDTPEISLRAIARAPTPQTTRVKDHQANASGHFDRLG